MIITKEIEEKIPKWPQFLITGNSVTIEQAKDIIFKTETFFTNVGEYSGGNNHEFNAKYRNDSNLIAIQNDWSKESILRDSLGTLCHKITYIDNDFAVSMHINGPNGWCHPDGKIWNNQNSGDKYPSADELLSECELIAQAFPYLDFTLTVMSMPADNEKSIPLFNIEVKEGAANFAEPDLSRHQTAGTPNAAGYAKGFVKQITEFLDRPGEGLPPEWIDEFALIVRNKIEELGWSK